MIIRRFRESAGQTNSSSGVNEEVSGRARHGGPEPTERYVRASRRERDYSRAEQWWVYVGRPQPLLLSITEPLAVTSGYNRDVIWQAGESYTSLLRDNDSTPILKINNWQFFLQRKDSANNSS